MLWEVATLWRYLAASGGAQRSDVLFCFGNAHLGTARRAAALYHDGLAPVVLVSGGHGGRVEPHPTEADGFAHVLAEAGVPRHAIVVETEADHTGENVELGLAALAQRGIRPRSVAAVTFPTSLRRSVATLRRHAPSLAVSGVPAFAGLGPFGQHRERAAALALGEIDKLRLYPALGHIAPAAIPPRVLQAAHRVRRALTEPAPSAGTRLDDLVAAGEA